MFKHLFGALALALALGNIVSAQNDNNNTAPPAPPTRRPVRVTRQTTTTTTATPATPPAPTTPAAAPPRRANGPARATASAAEQEVRATFDALLRAVEKTDVEAVMNFYWNSPQLLIFNNNGTVTRGWTQARTNLVSLYPDMKNVKLETRDVRVQMFGADGAVVSCLWTQTQEFKGVPESATGRLTVVFRHTGGAWKITHRHTSPEAPDPSRLAPSEQTTPPPATTTPPPPAARR